LLDISGKHGRAAKTRQLRILRGDAAGPGSAPNEIAVASSKATPIVVKGFHEERELMK